MTGRNERVLHVKGSPREVGYAMGSAIGRRLGTSIDHYLKDGLGKQSQIDWDRLRQEALPWLGRMPSRFREEIEGLAEGSGVGLQRVAEWCCADDLLPNGCSAFIVSIGGRAWVGRNNDYILPDMWGYVTIREVDGRIPTIGFGMECEPFTATGINAERLWLHYNYLPVWDSTTTAAHPIAPYVLLTEALETCRTIDEVEALLARTPRNGGMMIFALDGKVEAGAIFECGRTSHARRDLGGISGKWIVGTNHYCSMTVPHEPLEYAPESKRRYDRMAELREDLLESDGEAAPGGVPSSLIRVLADPAVEGRSDDFGTVYANVACPGSGEMWYTLGGFPAASAGDWAKIQWPWR